MLSCLFCARHTDICIFLDAGPLLAALNGVVWEREQAHLLHILHVMSCCHPGLAQNSMLVPGTLKCTTNKQCAPGAGPLDRYQALRQFQRGSYIHFLYEARPSPPTAWDQAGGAAHGRPS